MGKATTIGLKFLSKVVENISYIQILKKTNSCEYTEPPLPPRTMLLKNLKVTTSWSSLQSAQIRHPLGERGNNLFFSNFALSVPPL